MILLALLLGLARVPALAQVDAILSSREIAVPLQEGKCEPEAVLAIFSREGDNDPIGFAEIVGTLGATQCRATVTAHSRSALIRPGDRAVLLDLHERNRNLPGRYDLMREGRRDVAIRYKPVVYGGYLFGHTAATLDKKEILIGPSALIYGITNDLQIDGTPLLLIKNVGQLAGQYQFLRSEDVKLSLRLVGNRFFAIGRGSWEVELLYDSTSNTKSMTHTKLKYSSKLPESLPLESADKKAQGAAEISSVYEWILPSWHRILLGPKFTAGQEMDVGFLFSSLFLYDRFQWSANLEVNSLKKFDLKKYKQVFSFDLAWRF